MKDERKAVEKEKGEKKIEKQELQTDKRIAACGDKLFATAFKLAGIEDVFELDPQGNEAELVKAIEALLNDETAKERFALIILQDSVAERLSHRLRKAVEASTQPLFIIISLEGREMEEGGSIRELVKKALGIELK